MNFAPFNTHTTPLLKNCYNKFQVITQSDLGENQLSIQLLLHGIIFKTS